mmetsp:Transcript_36397/g.71629  ORF Transcript_36397/g.71629 Transcript_36397/m.71629 type:complete len:136 (-) Transcript_36397:372-779(-)
MRGRKGKEDRSRVGGVCLLASCLIENSFLLLDLSEWWIQSVSSIPFQKGIKPPRANRYSQTSNQPKRQRETEIGGYTWRERQLHHVILKTCNGRDRGGNRQDRKKEGNESTERTIYASAYTKKHDGVRSVVRLLK